MRIALTFLADSRAPITSPTRLLVPYIRSLRTDLRTRHGVTLPVYLVGIRSLPVLALNAH